MTVLKARIGGAWVTLPGGTDEVWVGSTAPTDSATELWYDTSAVPQSLVEKATYTPVLTGMVLGSGGSVETTLNYVYVGEVGVGGRGILSVDGRLMFGTTGATFPTGPLVSLPPGFNAGTVSSQYVGQSRLRNNDGSSTFGAVVAVNTLTTFNVFILNVGATYPVPTGITPTLPFTWAAGYSMTVSATLPVVRV